MAMAAVVLCIGIYFPPEQEMNKKKNDESPSIATALPIHRTHHFHRPPLKVLYPIFWDHGQYFIYRIGTCIAPEKYKTDWLINLKRLRMMISWILLLVIFVSFLKLLSTCQP
jgi:hypothetical protein